MLGDIRIAYEIRPGIIIYCIACRCGACKNFFMVPVSEIDPDPHFCPHCGIKFSAPTRGVDMSDEMIEVLDVIPGTEYGDFSPDPDPEEDSAQ